MLFKKKQKPQLVEAIHMVGDAVEIAYTYLRDKKHMPTKEELALLERFREALWAHHATAEYIARCMQQRARDKPKIYMELP